MKATALALLTAALFGSAMADDGSAPKGVAHLDHVFVIMMENHGYQQIINNPNEPYLNQLIANKTVNLAANYYAVGHPSLTNYLEIVGGSNFGVRSDKYPNWHSSTCTPYLASGIAVLDNNAGIPLPTNDSYVCPISGKGSDAATPAIDTFNEVTCSTVNGAQACNVLADLDGVKSVAQAKNIVGASIADQLVAAQKTWKSYQENLPQGGADLIDYSNGTASLVYDTTAGTTSVQPASLGSLSSGVVAAYAVKHNPFAYFANVQAGADAELSLGRVVGFDSLWADLATGDVPTYSFIAPNQCNDQHGRGNGDAFCAFDTSDSGLQAGLNPGLIAQGDVMIERLVTAIKNSPVWKGSRSAIVIVWDENDYSGIPTAPPAGTAFPDQNTNRVVVTVETNDQKGPGITSNRYYTSFSLLKSIESALDLPCLNHACDPGVAVMSDLFGAGE
jgi:phosphatidylinositol-3-phosphatase